MPVGKFLERIARANEKEFQGQRLSNCRLNRPCPLSRLKANSGYLAGKKGARLSGK